MSDDLNALLAIAEGPKNIGFEDYIRLDNAIREKSSKKFPKLELADIERLIKDLGTIAVGARLNETAHDREPPSSQARKLDELEACLSKTLELVGASDDQSPTELPVFVFQLFEDPESRVSDPAITLLAIRNMRSNVRAAQRALRGKHGKLPRGRTRSINYRLVDELGFIFATYWGAGGIPASAQSDLDGTVSGGPSVRFITKAHEIILGRPLSHQAAYDALQSIKKGEIDLSQAYSVFTPNGGSRIKHGV